MHVLSVHYVTIFVVFCTFVTLITVGNSSLNLLSDYVFLKIHKINVLIG